MASASAMPRKRWPIAVGLIVAAVVLVGTADFFGYAPGAFEMLLRIFKGVAKAL